MKRIFKVIKYLTPLPLAAFLWDSFFPSPASHCLWWVCFPILAAWWIYSSKTAIAKAGSILLVCGAMLNGVAILSNSGMMPVDRPERVGKPHGDEKHICMTDATKVPFLVDKYYGLGMIASMGDMIVFPGLALVISSAIFSIVGSLRGGVGDERKG